MQLGHRLKNAVHSIGHKVGQGAHFIGHKVIPFVSNTVLPAIKAGNGMVGTAMDAIETGGDVLRTLARGKKLLTRALPA